MDFELPAMGMGDAAHAAGPSASGASGAVGLERDFRRSAGDHEAGEGVRGSGASAPGPATNFSRPLRLQPAPEPAHVEEPAHIATTGVVGQANDHGFDAAPQTEAGHAGATAASQPSRISRWADRNKGFGDALDKALKPYTVPLTTIAGVSGLAIGGTALAINIHKQS